MCVCVCVCVCVHKHTHTHTHTHTRTHTHTHKISRIEKVLMCDFKKKNVFEKVSRLPAPTLYTIPELHILYLNCLLLATFYTICCSCLLLATFYTLSFIDYIHEATISCYSRCSRYSRYSLTSTYSTYKIYIYTYSSVTYDI